MPLQVTAKDFETLLGAIARFPEGVSVSKLQRVSELDFPRRTLQRRLEKLVAKRQLIPEGQGRGRRYRLPATLRLKEDTSRDIPTGAEWLSREAKEIRRLIQRPKALRIPVGYERKFLASYRPNQSFYLSAGIRQDLERLGKVGMTELPAGTYLRQIMGRLLIDLSWNSSRLEGNTYSLLETQRLLELGENAEGKNALEAQMLLNHKEAIEMLADQAGEIGFNRYTICNLHALLADNLLVDPSAGGRVRSRPVGISGTVFHPLEVPQLIEEYFDQVLEKAEAIRDPFEQAFFVMVQLPYLQPFEDVNKRVSRLAANIPLIRHNLCPLSFVDLEQEDYVGGLIGVYELNRVDYLRDVFVWAYRRSCIRYAAVRQSLGEPDPFRLRYREKIARLVRAVVQGLLNRQAAGKWLERETRKEIVLADRAKLIAVIEIELQSLHEGNMARYRLRPTEYAAWKKKWK